MSAGAGLAATVPAGSTTAGSNHGAAALHGGSYKPAYLKKEASAYKTIPHLLSRVYESVGLVDRALPPAAPSSAAATPAAAFPTGKVSSWLECEAMAHNEDEKDPLDWMEHWCLSPPLFLPPSIPP